MATLNDIFDLAKTLSENDRKKLKVWNLQVNCIRVAARNT